MSWKCINEEPKLTEEKFVDIDILYHGHSIDTIRSGEPFTLRLKFEGIATFYVIDFLDRNGRIRKTISGKNEKILNLNSCFSSTLYGEWLIRVIASIEGPGTVTATKNFTITKKSHGARLLKALQELPEFRPKKEELISRTLPSPRRKRKKINYFKMIVHPPAEPLVPGDEKIEIF